MAHTNGVLTKAAILAAGVPTTELEVWGGLGYVRSLPPSIVLRIQSEGTWSTRDCGDCFGQDPDCDECDGKGKVQSLDMSPFAAEIIQRGFVDADGHPIFELDEAEELLDTGDMAEISTVLEAISEASALNATAEEIQGN